MCGRNVASISLGKYWGSAVTKTGDVFMWDGKNFKDGIPIPNRLNGVKQATSVCVGETHLLVRCALYHPVYPPKSEAAVLKPISDVNGEAEELAEDTFFNDIEVNSCLKTIQNGNVRKKEVPSLKKLCEEVAKEFLVEPSNAIQLLEIADLLEAEDLRKHCDVLVVYLCSLNALTNGDYIFILRCINKTNNSKSCRIYLYATLILLFVPQATTIASASTEILAKLEKLLDTRSSETWSYCCLPTPTATFTASINSDEEDNEKGFIRFRDDCENALKKHRDSNFVCFPQSVNITDPAIFKQVRALKKKLQQIEILEAKQLNGHNLDD